MPIQQLYYQFCTDKFAEGLLFTFFVLFFSLLNDRISGHVNSSINFQTDS